MRIIPYIDLLCAAENENFSSFLVDRTLCVPVIAILFASLAVNAMRVH